MQSNVLHRLIAVSLVQVLLVAHANADTRVLDAPVGLLVASNTPTPAPVDRAASERYATAAATQAAGSQPAGAKAAVTKPAAAKPAPKSVARKPAMPPARTAAPAPGAPVRAHKVITHAKSHAHKKSAKHKHHTRAHARHRQAAVARAEPYREFWTAPREFSVMAGTQQTYEHPRAIKQIAVGNDKVATVEVVSGHTLLINAVAPGVTSLAIWSNPKSARPDVDARLVVTPNVEAEKRALSSASISVDAPMNKLRLSGSIESLVQHDNLNQAVTAETKQIDNTVANFESQVQIDIKIVEVNRSKLMHSNIFLAKNSNNTTVGTSGSAGISAQGSILSLVSSITTSALVIGNASRGLYSQFDILETNGFAYTLAEPTLVALSGQTATFLAGGEIPIPVAVTTSNGQSNITIQFKEFGVKLALTPTVLDAHRIFLKVAPEVSELDPANGVTLSGTQIPGFRVRRTDTTVALGDGESFIISGLVSRDTLANANKIPGLGNLPFIGAFFKSNDFNRNDRELVMIVTPHIVKPIAANAEKPPLPGERYRNYNPDFSDFVFKESGDFNLPVGGFSK